MTIRTRKKPVQRWLLTEDGVRIGAQLQQPVATTKEPPIGVVVVHGFAGFAEKLHNRRITDELSADMPVIAIDLRGHGRSDGQSSLGDTEVFDVAAAVRWGRVLGWRRVVTLGFSMGAGIVVRHGGLFGGIDGVVSISGPAFWNYRGTAVMRRLHFGVEHPVGRVLVRHGMRTRVLPPPWPVPWPPSPQEAAALLPPVPFLVVHGTDDAFFPIEHAEALVAAADAGAQQAGLVGYRAQLWLGDFGHAEAAIPVEFIQQVAAWVRDLTD